MADMTIDSAPASAALIERASKVVPGGVNSGRRRIDPPLCFREGRGAHLQDLDGRRFIDYHAAWGPIILGHAYESVTEAVSRQASHLVLTGIGTTEGEAALAEKIVEHVPSIEQVVLCASGNEATYYATRLARAVTGRDKLIKFQGCYHGCHDYLLGGSAENAGAGAEQGIAERRRDPRGRSSGVLESAAAETLVCGYNDLESVEAMFRACPDAIAAVVVEPFAHNCSTILPVDGFLEGLRSICDREGALLVFDEVISGFRHALGGVQSIVDVMPDLTTLGKAIGNGYPIAAIGGATRFMERFSTRPGGDVFVGGTNNGNAVACAAALATIETLETEPVYEHVYALGERVRSGLQEIGERAGISVTVAGYGSLFVMMFMEPPIASYEDFLRNDVDLFVGYRRNLLKRGVLKMPDHLGCRSHISYAHTSEDIDLTLEAAEAALAEALKDGGAR
jgi:glutamate-1-semialdehyde 2,1-aminomutase